MIKLKKPIAIFYRARKRQKCKRPNKFVKMFLFNRLEKYLHLLTSSSTKYLSTLCNATNYHDYVGGQNYFQDILRKFKPFLPVKRNRSKTKYLLIRVFRYKYRKYWRVSRAYFNFLNFFCGFTFKLIYYLEVIL